MKFVELSIAIVLGGVEDENIFKMLNFVKSKLQNWLMEHMDQVVWMYAKKYFIGLRHLYFTMPVKMV
jgi:hypothetical protein